MTVEARHRYLVALGSNRRFPGVGSPRAVVAAAIEHMHRAGWQIDAVSRVIASTPVGPSRRRYANAAAVVRGEFDPPRALASLQGIEAQFGRERRGLRWRARTLDLDIVLWSGGRWSDSMLTIPHPLFGRRPFVLGPAASIAPHWRDPVTGLSLRQMAMRSALAERRRGADAAPATSLPTGGLTACNRAPRAPAWSGP